jgi:acetoin utilization protein AcuB
MFIRFVDGIQTSYVPRPHQPSGTVEPVTQLHSTSAVSQDPDSNPSSQQRPPPFNPYAQRVPTEPPPRNPAIRVGQIMTSPVVSLPPHSLLREAHTLFQARRYRHIPIIDDDGVVRGIVSDRDVLRQLADSHDAAPKEIPLERFMNRQVLTSREETDIRTAARVLFEERIGCLPVCDGNGRVVGILTRSDILRAVIQNAPLELWI